MGSAESNEGIGEYQQLAEAIAGICTRVEALQNRMKKKMGSYFGLDEMPDVEKSKEPVSMEAKAKKDIDKTFEALGRIESYMARF